MSQTKSPSDTTECEQCDQEFGSEFEYMMHDCPEDDLEVPDYK